MSRQRSPVQRRQLNLWVQSALLDDAATAGMDRAEFSRMFEDMLADAMSTTKPLEDQISDDFIELNRKRKSDLSNLYWLKGRYNLDKKSAKEILKGLKA